MAAQTVTTVDDPAVTGGRSGGDWWTQHGDSGDSSGGVGCRGDPGGRFGGVCGHAVTPVCVCSGDVCCRDLRCVRPLRLREAGHTVHLQWVPSYYGLASAIRGSDVVATLILAYLSRKEQSGYGAVRRATIAPAVSSAAMTAVDAPSGEPGAIPAVAIDGCSGGVW